MHGHQQRAAAVALLDVDGEAEAEVLVAHDVGLAVGALGVGRVHHRGGAGDGLDDGVADDVGEADLPGPGAAQVAVDDLAVDLEQLGRDLAERRRRRHREAGLHVGDDAGRGTAQRRAGRLGRGGSCCRRRRCGRSRSSGCRCGGGGQAATGGRGGAVVLEEVAPALADGVRVGEVLLVHLVDQPGVRARDLGGGVIGHEVSGYRWRQPPLQPGARSPTTRALEGPGRGE